VMGPAFIKNLRVGPRARLREPWPAFPHHGPNGRDPSAAPLPLPRLGL
jgi:hypothetical protein